MNYSTAQKHGKLVCDVVEMLETFSVTFNHHEDDKRLQQIVAPMMKVAAHALSSTLEALNDEERSHPECLRDGLRHDYGAEYHSATAEEMADKAH